VSVFLDGVRVNEPTAEEINFDLLPTEDVERIEVVPGPSVLFGRNTLAGALILVTRRGKEGLAGSRTLRRGAPASGSPGPALGGAGPIDFYAVRSPDSGGWLEGSIAREALEGLRQARLPAGRDRPDALLSVREQPDFQAGPLPASELAQDSHLRITRLATSSRRGSTRWC